MVMGFSGNVRMISARKFAPIIRGEFAVFLYTLSAILLGFYWATGSTSNNTMTKTSQSRNVQRHYMEPPLHCEHRPYKFYKNKKTTLMSSFVLLQLLAKVTKYRLLEYA